MKFFELYEFAKLRSVISESTFSDVSNINSASINVADFEKIRDFLGKESLQKSGVVDNAIKLNLYAGQGGQHVAKRDLESLTPYIPVIAVLCTFFELINLKEAWSTEGGKADKLSDYIKKILITDTSSSTSSVPPPTDPEIEKAKLFFVKYFLQFIKLDKGQKICTGFEASRNDTQKFLEVNKEYISYRLMSKLNEAELTSANITMVEDKVPLEAMSYALALGFNDSQNQNPLESYKNLLSHLVTAAQKHQLMYNGINSPNMGSLEALKTANSGSITVPFFANIIRNIKADKDPVYTSKVKIIDRLSDNFINLAHSLYILWSNYFAKALNGVGSSELSVWSDPKTAKINITSQIYFRLLVGDYNVVIPKDNTDIDENWLLHELRPECKSGLYKPENEDLIDKNIVVKTLKQLKVYVSGQGNQALIALMDDIYAQIKSLMEVQEDPSYLGVLNGVGDALGAMNQKLKGL